MMLRKLFLLPSWLALGAAIALFGALPATAQHHLDHLTRCSLASLQGTYGMLMEGTVLSNPIPLSAPTPPYHLVMSGTVTFDGSGNVSANTQQSLGGFIVSSIGTGTYDVNPDCSFSAEFCDIGGTARRIGSITGEGRQREIYMMSADAWWVGSGTAKKVPAGRCSAATLKGSYALFGSGTRPLVGMVLVTQVGVAAFDGRENISGRDSANIMGTVVPASFTGIYTVESDCKASATIHTFVGDIHEEGVITGTEKLQEFRGIVTDPGWTFAQTLTKQ